MESKKMIIGNFNLRLTEDEREALNDLSDELGTTTQKKLLFAMVDQVGSRIKQENKEVQSLKKEIEALKNENEDLKKNNLSLKDENVGGLEKLEVLNKELTVSNKSILEENDNLLKESTDRSAIIKDLQEKHRLLTKNFLVLEDERLQKKEGGVFVPLSEKQRKFLIIYGKVLKKHYKLELSDHELLTKAFFTFAKNGATDVFPLVIGKKKQQIIDKININEIDKAKI